MRAISIHQPWANAILYQGKTVENRTWAPLYRGKIAIHASKSKKSYDDMPPEIWRVDYGCELPKWDTLPIGCLVGVATFTRCFDFYNPDDEKNISEQEMKWACGPLCWVLKDVIPFKVPMPYRGAQGLFEVPDSIIEQCLKGNQ